MTPVKQPVPILMAEDDEDDRLLFQEAMQESHFANPLYFAQDGEELIAFLRRQGRYADPTTSLNRHTCRHARADML